MSKRTKRKGISLVLQLWMPVLIVAVALPNIMGMIKQHRQVVRQRMSTPG